MPETKVEMLKSNLLCIQNQVDELANDGIDFNKHFYVPLIDTKTGLPNHEREDHNHVLKRIAKHIQDSGIPGVDLVTQRNCFPSKWQISSEKKATYLKGILLGRLCKGRCDCQLSQ